MLLVRLSRTLIILSAALSFLTTAHASADSTATDLVGVTAIVLLLSRLIALLLLLILARYYVFGVYIFLGSCDGLLHESRLAMLRFLIFRQMTGGFDCPLHVVVAQVVLQLPIVSHTVCEPMIGHVLKLRRRQRCCARNSHDLIVKVGQTLSWLAVNTGQLAKHLRANLFLVVALFKMEYKLIIRQG